MKNKLLRLETLHNHFYSVVACGYNLGFAYDGYSDTIYD